MTRILVCGGREFDNWRLLKSTLDFYLELADDLTIIHGGAKGADFLAQVWAKYNNVKQECYPANWKEYGKSAGFIRNKRMLDDGKPTFVLAFPGGNGTKNMVDISKEAGINVVLIEE